MILTLDIKKTKNTPNTNNNIKSKKSTDDKVPDENPYLKFKQKARDSTKTYLNAAITASKNINENIQSNVEKARGSQSYQEIQEKLAQFEKSVKIKQSDLTKNSPKVFSKVKNGFLSGFEQIVGRIRIGTQYGKGSIDLLSDLAKLKELGIITEDEFNSKKREILDRV